MCLKSRNSTIAKLLWLPYALIHLTKFDAVRQYCTMLED